VYNRHLVDRIAELTEACRGLEQTRGRALAEAETLRLQVTTLDADLTAVRTSFRRLIREENNVRAN
jgi:phage shock protein A